jgi:hypothetical protein
MGGHGLAAMTGADYRVSGFLFHESPLSQPLVMYHSHTCHSESAMAGQPIQPIQLMIGSIGLIG